MQPIDSSRDAPRIEPARVQLKGSERSFAEVAAEQVELLDTEGTSMRWHSNGSIGGGCREVRLNLVATRRGRRGEPTHLGACDSTLIETDLRFVS